MKENKIPNECIYSISSCCILLDNRVGKLGTNLKSFSKGPASTDPNWRPAQWHTTI